MLRALVPTPTAAPEDKVDHEPEEDRLSDSALLRRAVVPGGGERYPLNLAKGIVEASGGTCTVELISYGEKSARQTLSPGVALRVLQIANRPGDRTNVASWELPAALADADLVHIHSPFTRSSELGILAAKQQHKPLCMTDHGGTASTIGLNLGSLELADRIIAYSDFGASLYWTKTPITIVKGGVDASTFSPSAQPTERDRVLYVGRLLPHKGIDHLIKAAPAWDPLDGLRPAPRTRIMPG